MKSLIFLLPFLTIYVFTKPEETIKIYATNPPDKVETVHIDNSRPTPTPETNTGLASWYDRSACASRIYGSTCKTANGEIFDETKNTVACARRFRLGTHFRLYYLDRSIDVVCNDRGNFESMGRTFDLSPAAFGSLANLNRGVIKVKFEIIKLPIAK